MIRARLLAAACAFQLFPARSFAQDNPPLQRYLVDLYLGDNLDTVRRVYPQAASREWPSYIDPRTRVSRIQVRKTSAKRFPARAETLWLGARGDRLVEIQVIYDEDYTRDNPPEALVKELSLVYGEPKRSGTGKFWWSDGEQVLRVHYIEVPVMVGRQKSVELRTCIQLMDAGLLRRTPRTESADIPTQVFEEPSPAREEPAAGATTVPTAIGPQPAAKKGKGSAGAGVPEGRKGVCEAGDAAACHDLANRIFKGEGVAQDKARAADLYEKACDMGSAKGCYVLGMIYYDGEAQDKTRGSELIRKACAMGDQKACEKIKKL